MKEKLFLCLAGLLFAGCSVKKIGCKKVETFELVCDSVKYKMYYDNCMSDYEGLTKWVKDCDAEARKVHCKKVRMIYYLRGERIVDKETK